MNTAIPCEPKSMTEERIATGRLVENPLLTDMAELVHRLWQQRGGQSESAEDDWREAEQQLSR